MDSELTSLYEIKLLLYSRFIKLNQYLFTLIGKFVIASFDGKSLEHIPFIKKEIFINMINRFNK